MEKITADQARALAGPTIEERVDQILLDIKEVATNKGRFLIIRRDEQFWTSGGYSQTPEWKTACDLIRAQGFHVEFFYEERQFVDMGTIVKW